MGITDRQIIKTIGSEEIQKMKILLAEAERRGLSKEVEHLARQLRLLQHFSVDYNGYFVKRDGKSFNANVHQNRFIQSNARFVALISGRGGGKSSSSAQKALRRIAKGESGVVMNPDMENLKISTWPEFSEWIPWSKVIKRHRYMGELGWSPSKPFEFSFINGAKVICKGVKEPDSARGPNINWLWYDEAGRDKDGLAWTIAVASVRVGKDPQAWISTTPKGKLHWIYDFFVKEDIPEDARKLFEETSQGRELVETIYTTIQDNIDNLDPGFVAALMALMPKGYLRDQELHGKFVTEGGALGDASWFDGHKIPVMPPSVKLRIRYWDLAASEKKIVRGKKRSDPDETVGTRMSWDGKKDFYIENQVCGYWRYEGILDNLIKTAKEDGPFVKIWIEEEPGAGGKNQVAAIAKEIKEKLGAAWKVEGHRPEGDKVMRAQAWFSEAAAGHFWLVDGDWNEPFLDQMGAFPDVKHDDKVDSVSGARQIIAPYQTYKDIQFLNL